MDVPDVWFDNTQVSLAWQHPLMTFVIPAHPFPAADVHSGRLKCAFGLCVVVGG